ncbi:hypothetical protein Pelo_17088 [Pelomyxa schiedti]|nr:hypothetical protein Pelo_17088 [Pelomyxa schiedti]
MFGSGFVQFGVDSKINKVVLISKLPLQYHPCLALLNSRKLSSKDSIEANSSSLADCALQREDNKKFHAKCENLIPVSLDASKFLHSVILSPLTFVPKIK